MIIVFSRGFFVVFFSHILKMASYIIYQLFILRKLNEMVLNKGQHIGLLYLYVILVFDF